MTSKTISIKVPVLARVEGEGALEIEVDNNQITNLQLKIYEPPRLFEQLLVGRSYSEVLDTVARICGICPVAYQMSATHALEQAFDFEVSDHIYQLRRLFYCGEWMESHGLHMHLLAAPDFLGYDSALDMANDHPDVLERGLHLQHLGNQIVALFGARSVHPVGTQVGGFYKTPKKTAITELIQALENALTLCEDLVNWTNRLDLPDHKTKFTSVALTHEQEYPMNHGIITTIDGLKIPKEAFQNYMVETQVAYSTALHAHINGQPYMVGPLARMNLNFDQLPDQVKALSEQANLTWPSQNMFHSIIARALEIYYCCLEALRILKSVDFSKPIKSNFTVKAGVGYGATEAPRGLLWHRYEIDDKGLVKNSIIVPPTSQNQAQIESDLYQTLNQYGFDDTDSAIRLLAEKVIRNYDPCISCSTHFLDLRLNRR